MEKIKQLQNDITEFIGKCDFGGNPTELYEPISYTILQKCERLRPMLCLLANDMFDGDEADALWPALALETFHNFTLIRNQKKKVVLGLKLMNRNRKKSETAQKFRPITKAEFQKDIGMNLLKPGNQEM